MTNFRSGWLLPALALAAVLPVVAQQPRQDEVATAAHIYGYNLAEGNWIYSPASCEAMPGVVLFHYHRAYSDGAESNFTALVPRSMGHVRIVPVLYHGATPFVPAPRNPRNFTLFNSLVDTADISGPNAEKHWLELASCYAEMTGGNDFLSAPIASPEIAGQPSPTVGVTIQDKTARVIFAERDSDHTYRVWDLLFNRDGRIKLAQTQEQSVYAPKIARSTIPAAIPETQPAKNTAAQPTSSPAMNTARETASRPIQLSTSQADQHASIESEPTQPAPAPAAGVSPSPVAESQNASAQPSQPGWKLVVNPPQPPSKFIPNAPTPPGTTVGNPPASPQ